MRERQEEDADMLYLSNKVHANEWQLKARE